MQNKNCYIIGSGASIRKNQWKIPTNSLPIWSFLKNKAVFTLNWGYKFIDPVAEVFVDHRFLDTEFDKIKNLSLLIGKQDSYYHREKDKVSDMLDNNLFLLKNASGVKRKYWGGEAWTQGFYTSQLSGIWAISIALQLGYDKVFLLGYDGNETKGRTHFYQDDNKTGHIIWNGRKQTGVGKDEKGKFKTGTYNKDLNTWFEPLWVVSHKVFNVNPDSNIHIFPKISYKELYEQIKDDVDIDKEEEQERIKSIIRSHYDK